MPRHKSNKGKILICYIIIIFLQKEQQNIDSPNVGLFFNVIKGMKYACKHEVYSQKTKYCIQIEVLFGIWSIFNDF